MSRYPVKLPHGFTIVEVMIAVGILAFIVIAAATMLSQKIKFQKEIQFKGEQEDLKQFLRSFLDCRQTISTQQALCDAPTPQYIQVKDRKGEVLIDRWPKSSAYGANRSLRAQCINIGPSQYQLNIEWAKLAAKRNLTGEFEHLSAGIKTSSDFLPLFKPIPVVCSQSAEAECSSSAVMSHKISVSFPPTPSWVKCDDNSGGTRELDQKFEENRTITIPKYSEICSMKVEIPTTSFEYDDEFALTFDGVILASSYYPRPPNATQPLKFSWQYISSQRYLWDNPGSITHCASPKVGAKILKASKCSMPTGRGVTLIKRGTLKVEINSEASKFIMDSIKSNTVHSLKMITFGNGVTAGRAGDCYHSAFNLKIDITYLP